LGAAGSELLAAVVHGSSIHDGAISAIHPGVSGYARLACLVRKEVVLDPEITGSDCGLLLDHGLRRMDIRFTGFACTPDSSGGSNDARKTDTLGLSHPLAVPDYLGHSRLRCGVTRFLVGGSSDSFTDLVSAISQARSGVFPCRPTATISLRGSIAVRA